MHTSRFRRSVGPKLAHSYDEILLQCNASLSNQPAFRIEGCKSLVKSAGV